MAEPNPASTWRISAIVELLTDRFEESLDFFIRRLRPDRERARGRLRLSARLGRLRVPHAEADRRATPPGSAMSPIAPPRRRRWSGGWRRSRRWAAASAGSTATSATVGPTVSAAPDGHVFELYYDTRKYEPPEGERPALKNVAQRYHGRGVCAAAARPPEPAGAGRGGDARLHDRRARQPRDRADPARQRPARRLLVHRQQQELRHRLHRGPRRRRAAASTTSPTRSTSARTCCAPPTSSSRTASSSRPGRTSTRSRARSSSMSGSRPATASRWRTPARG